MFAPNVAQFATMDNKSVFATRLAAVCFLLASITGAQETDHRVESPLNGRKPTNYIRRLVDGHVLDAFPNALS